MKPCDCDFQREDRRTARTKAQLSGALIDLLMERGWEAIGVRELCARANVARSTFYLHFRNKEELLEDGFQALRGTVRGVAPKQALKETGRFGFVNGVGAHIFDNRRLFLAMVGGNGGGVVREKFRQLLSDMILEELKAAGIADANKAHFLSGGFVSLATLMMMRDGKGAAAFCSAFQAMALPVADLENSKNPPSASMRTAVAAAAKDRRAA